MKDFGLKKLYYSISEVSKLTSLEQYILRYWESEFEQLKPAKNRAGNRIYTNKDIKLILKIKKLLKEEKYTIEGAKNILLEEKKSNSDLKEKAKKVSTQKDSEIVTPKPSNSEGLLKNDLEELREFLLDLHSRL